MRNVNPANTYTALIKSLSPIAHGDTALQDSSNTTVFMREKRFCNGSVIYLPNISENAVRHVFFREPLANHLMKAVNPNPLPKSVISLFYSGGNMNEKAPGDENTLARQVYETFPMLELLGGAVNQFILPRSALKLVALPVSKEYMTYLSGLLSEEDLELVKDNAQLSIFDFLTTETRTRGTGGNEGDNQMIYNYETLAAGMQFFIRATLSPHTSELAKSALGLGFHEWDCFFGGQARQGRGLCSIQRHSLPDRQLYVDFIQSNIERLKQALESGTLGSSKVLCKD